MCPTFLAGTKANHEDSKSFDCEIFPFSILFKSKIFCKFLIRSPDSSHLLLSLDYICVAYICVAYVSKPAPEWPILQNKLHLNIMLLALWNRVISIGLLSDKNPFHLFIGPSNFHSITQQSAKGLYDAFWGKECILIPCFIFLIFRCFYKNKTIQL